MDVISSTTTVTIQFSLSSCRSWCPDRVLPQALKYISESMGVKYAEGVILNIEEMWKESNIRVPMVCFLSMGSDPTNDIDQLSRKHNLSKINDKFSCTRCHGYQVLIRISLLSPAPQHFPSFLKLVFIHIVSFHLQHLELCQWVKVRRSMPGDY